EEARKKNEEELAALKKEREEAHKKLESTMDKLGFNIGMGVEEMFADGLKNNPTIHDIHFDYVHKNVEFFNDKGDTATEIDIVLVNKQSVALVETKHRFRKEDLEKFLEKQYPLFQKYGGIILRENIYLFIAGLSYDPIVIKQAQELGIGILHLKNEVIEVEGEVKNYYQ
ncbi:MAG: NERD domain-containing protein, partial [Chitinophagaceae bacterium]|nr:NERD domain-containing protein [Chitinophagaceae bacterium]